MSSESWKLPVIILVLINLLASLRAQDQIPRVCMNNGNYASNSTYRANLNTLLSSLSSNVGDSGFYSASVGQNQDRVNAIVLCRGDQQLNSCRRCVQIAADGLVQLCPNRKQAFIWYELCMLRYSNEPIYEIQTNDPGYILRNDFDVKRPEQFREDRTKLLGDLRDRAANGSAVRKVAGGYRSTSNADTIYGLLQCTPDLSPQDCSNCLIRAAHELEGCCNSARGMRILMPSCNLRYELYPFYNETRLQELQVLVSPVPSSPGNEDGNTTGKKDDNTTRIVVIVVVPIVVVCLILAASTAIFLRKRKKQEPQEVQESLVNLHDFHRV